MGLNKQTTQLIDFIENHKPHMRRVLTIMLSNMELDKATKRTKEYIFLELTTDVKDNYSIIHDFTVHCLGLVEWENIAKYYLEKKGELSSQQE